MRYLLQKSKIVVYEIIAEDLVKYCVSYIFIIPCLITTCFPFSYNSSLILDFDAQPQQ